MVVSSRGLFPTGDYFRFQQGTIFVSNMGLFSFPTGDCFRFQHMAVSYRGPLKGEARGRVAHGRAADD